MIAERPPPEALPAADFLVPDRLEEVLIRFGERYAVFEPRGVASQWSKWYFLALLVPELLARALLWRSLPVALDRLHLLLASDGRVERLCFQRGGAGLHTEDESLTLNLLDDNLAPLIEALAGFSGASPRVFWSNAGNVFEQCLGQLAHHPDALPGMTDDLQHFLTQRRLADGRRNPLYRPVRYQKQSDGSTRRVRRLCCIRYLVPELGYCGNCPLKEPNKLPNEMKHKAHGAQEPEHMGICEDSEHRATK